MYAVKPNPATGRYDCLYCHSDFSRMEHLRRHWISIHLNIKFKCQLCGQMLSRPDKLRRHYRQVHRLKNPPLPAISGVDKDQLMAVEERGASSQGNNPSRPGGMAISAPEPTAVAGAKEAAS